MYLFPTLLNRRKAEQRITFYFESKSLFGSLYFYFTVPSAERSTFIEVIGR